MLIPNTTQETLNYLNTDIDKVMNNNEVQRLALSLSQCMDIEITNRAALAIIRIDRIRRWMLMSFSDVYNRFVRRRTAAQIAHDILSEEVKQQKEIVGILTMELVTLLAEMKRPNYIELEGIDEEITWDVIETLSLFVEIFDERNAKVQTIFLLGDYLHRFSNYILFADAYTHRKKMKKLIDGRKQYFGDSAEKAKTALIEYFRCIRDGLSEREAQKQAGNKADVSGRQVRRYIKAAGHFGGVPKS